jgi:hypothetical protein
VGCEVGRDVLDLLALTSDMTRDDTHKVGQVDVALGVKKHVVGLDVPVHNALPVDVADRAAKLGYPEAHCFFCERLPRDVEAKIAAIHQIHHNVPRSRQYVALYVRWGPRTDIRCPGSCTAGCTGRGG